MTPGTSLGLVAAQIAEASAARKCHGCGCFQKTVDALENSPAVRELSSFLIAARLTFVEKKYDCLGCEVCFPAVAANAFSEAFPEAGATLDLCPSEEPEQRRGWPPLPGDFTVMRYRAPVAVCTLNSADLAANIVRSSHPAIAIVGTMHTENLGIERIIRNVLANPHIRFIVLCGEDTRQSIGHLPGQSLVSLLLSGVEPDGRIKGARGKRPVLKNVSTDLVTAFLQQIELVNLVGEHSVERIIGVVDASAARSPGPFADAPMNTAIHAVVAQEPKRLVPDPAGFVVVYPDRARSLIVLEHYSNAGLLDQVIEGRTPTAVYSTVIERGLISRLDHAAYLGRELANAERSLRTDELYVQDRAPGEIVAESDRTATCGCGPSCSPGVST